jgi:hypothetical protein
LIDSILNKLSSSFSKLFSSISFEKIISNSLFQVLYASSIYNSVAAKTFAEKMAVNREKISNFFPKIVFNIIKKLKNILQD